MVRNWTFGRKIGAGFAVTVLLAVTICAVAVLTLHSVVASKDGVISGSSTMLLGAERLRADTAEKSAASRGYLFTADVRYLEKVRESRSEFLAQTETLRHAAASADERRLIDAIRTSELAHHALVEQTIEQRRTASSADAVRDVFDTKVAPARAQLDNDIDAFIAAENVLLATQSREASDSANSASNLVLSLGFLCAVFAVVIAVAVTRTLGKQVATAVGQVESSSAELQSAASQQATGAKEEAMAMAEITTTMNELLATSRQIAESAQRVAQVAEQTASTARTGRGTVDHAQDTVGGIRRQVDQIVEHMLELGDKSQQIGAVLDIVAELAEQTNILAINATIEAAGAGENGTRFAVVADEIRNLADRVAGSAKEIRDLIEEIRGAVNTTVMATETGSKTVDDGTRQFGAVAESLREIVDLVLTTAEAAREIELSTKQQTTAVEQVNVAIVSVAQATRETEASSNETRQTATQLAVLSKDLLRMVHPQGNG